MEGVDASEAELRQVMYPLHAAVWHGDGARVAALLGEHNVNQPDHHGNTPLHLAVMLGNRALSEALLQAGGNPRARNRAGWSVLQEGITGGDRMLLRTLYQHTREQMWARWQARLPSLLETIQEMPDFELKLRWEFSSWIPFVSRLCPNDVYTIRKRGSAVRIDTTIVDFENYRWIRGNVSFWFTGGDIFMVDHDKGTKADLLSGMKNPTEEDTEMDVDNLLASDNVRTDTRTDNVTFTQKRGWLGGDRKDDVEGFACTVFDMGGLDHSVYVRPQRTRQKNKQEHEEFISMLEYFGSTDDLHGDTYEAIEEKEEFDPETLENFEELEARVAAGENPEDIDPAAVARMALRGVDDSEFADAGGDGDGSGDGDDKGNGGGDGDNKDDDDDDEFFDADGDNEAAESGLVEASVGPDGPDKQRGIRRHMGKFVHKKIKAKLWLSEDFPLPLERLMPLLEVLAPTSSHFGKLKRFIELKFPEGGFPVKIEIPVVPAALKGLVTFLSYLERDVAEDELEIPDDYQVVEIGYRGAD